MHAILAIALGGALGSVFRYLFYGLTFTVTGNNFPFGTLFVNVMGCFLMGILIAVFEVSWQPPKEVKLFLMTGCLAAFTTFSNFSMDAIYMMEEGQYAQSAIYVGASVVLSIAAMFVAMVLVRQLAP